MTGAASSSRTIAVRAVDPGFINVDRWLTAARLTDRSLSIDAQELSLCLRQFGYNLSQSFIDLVIFKFDRAGARTIGFDDFIQICILLQKLTDGFKRFDTQRVRSPARAEGTTYTDFRSAERLGDHEL